MDECFKCGLKEDQSLLYEVITNQGIMKICRKCSIKESLPIIGKKSEEELKDLERKHDLYDRLSKSSGEAKRKINFNNLKLEKQDISLRNLVEKNISKGLSVEAKPRDDLIENFHWIVTHARRMKHISQKQLAEEIRETERAIELAEKGVVPDGYQLVKKLESSLRIRLIKPEFREKYGFNLEKLPDRRINFSLEKDQNLKISDLVESKKKVGDSNSVKISASDKKPSISTQEEILEEELEDLEFEEK